MERGLKSEFLQRKIRIYEANFPVGKFASPRNIYPERDMLYCKKFLLSLH